VSAGRLVWVEFEKADPESQPERKVEGEELWRDEELAYLGMEFVQKYDCQRNINGTVVELRPTKIRGTKVFRLLITIHAATDVCLMATGCQINARMRLKMRLVTRRRQPDYFPLLHWFEDLRFCLS
jgi:hypothetical protein